MIERWPWVLVVLAWVIFSVIAAYGFFTVNWMFGVLYVGCMVFLILVWFGPEPD